jgi:hypothetical protein
MCQPPVSANQNAASTLDILGMVEAYRQPFGDPGGL